MRNTAQLFCIVRCISRRSFAVGVPPLTAASAGGGKKKSTTLNRRGAAAANEWQPLLWAAKENHMPIAKLLLDLGADINEQQPITTSSSQYSALHLVAQKGHEEMTQFLLDRGIKKELRDKHNNTALMLAEKKQNASIVSLLGGDPTQMKRGPVD